MPATISLVGTEAAEGARGLGRQLGARNPADWPPQYHDEDTLGFTRDRLSESADQHGWWLHYLLVDDDSGSTVVGTGGYKGPPRDGVVEIGYSVVPSHQSRGIATEAARQLIDTARRRDPCVHTVVAHTLPDLLPSIAVLRKLGFAPAAPPEPGVLAFQLALSTPRLGLCLRRTHDA